MFKPGFELPTQTYGYGDTALIIGAGLAGCAVANALSHRGLHCKLYDQKDTTAAATSAVPVAIYRPYSSTGNTIRDRYFLNGFQRLLTELDRYSQIPRSPNGVLQPIADSKKWSDDQHWRVVSKAAASNIAARKINSPALYFPTAGSLSPAMLCNAWLANAKNTTLHNNINVCTIEKSSSGWQLLNNQQQVIDDGKVVVLANGNNVNDLIAHDPLPLTPVRGQLTYFKTNPLPLPDEPIVCNRGHIVPVADGYWAGATHQRDDNNTRLCAADDQANLHTLQQLHDALSSEPCVQESWAGIRCSTSDRLPLIGGVPDSVFYRREFRDLHHGRLKQRFQPARYHNGLYVLAGLGSRGTTQAMYAAECLAGIITGNSVIDPLLLSKLHPARFLLKQLTKRPV